MRLKVSTNITLHTMGPTAYSLEFAVSWGRLLCIVCEVVLIVSRRLVGEPVLLHQHRGWGLQVCNPHSVESCLVYFRMYTSRVISCFRR